MNRVDGDLVSAVRRSCERSRVPGAVLAIATDDDVEDVAVGVAAIETAEEMRPDHQFPAMSLAKSMTAVMLLELAGTGAVRFEEPIGARIAALEDVPWASEVNVDQLLTCTGGLPAFAFPDTGDGDDAIAAFPLHLCDEVLVHPPGERFSYSNSSFSLAAAIVESVAGDLYDDLLSETILHPLSLRDTGSWYRTPPARPVVQHWTLPDATAPIDWWRVRSSTGAGAGTIYTTASDLARYGIAHIDRWPELRQPTGAFPGPHAESWGRGWAVYGWDGGVFGWDGHAPGGRTYLRVLPDHRAAVALLTNASSGRAVYRDVFPHLLEERFEIAMAPETLDRPPVDLHDPGRAVGRYVNGKARCTISEEAHGLVLTDMLGASLPLTPVGDGCFVTSGGFDYPVVELDGDFLVYFGTAWRRDDA